MELKRNGDSVKKLLIIPLILWSTSAFAGYKVTGNLEVTGNAGIGSASPSQKVDVAGTVKATAFIGDGSGLTGVSSITGLTPGKLPKATTSSTLGDSLIYSDGTNVGIATTVPVAKLDIEGAVYQGNGNVGLGSVTPRTKLDVIGSVTAIQFFGDGSQLSGVSGSNYWAADGVGINTTNNVGLGTINPTQKLEVVGTVKATRLMGTVVRGTFTYNDFVGVPTVSNLTITHNLGLSAPYAVQVSFFNGSGQVVWPDSITGATNSVVADFTSYGNIGTASPYGYVYVKD